MLENSLYWQPVFQKQNKEDTRIINAHINKICVVNNIVAQIVAKYARLKPRSDTEILNETDISIALIP